MSFKQILLVNREVQDYQVFLDSANDITCAIPYTSSTTQEELMELIHAKTTRADRIGFVFTQGQEFFVDQILLIEKISIKNWKIIRLINLNTIFI